MEKIRCKKSTVIFVMLFMAICMFGFKYPEKDISGRLVQFETDSLNEAIYFVDTIDIANPIILSDRKTGYNYIKNTTVDELKSLSKKGVRDIQCMDWTLCLTEMSEPVIIYALNFMSVRFVHCIQKYSMLSEFTFHKIDDVNLKNWVVLKFEKKPDKYFLFMVKGKMFNYLAYERWIDKVYDYKFEFPNENLYYPVVVPVNRK